ncbi:ABC transporter ATP-binding protein [Paenibacillus massiliensis]|uniref:ABC transporter ATP-binding protein n=1 Tax=Paenibacillus massiliensis TaxID=225917 RepID=UPI00035D60C2|nr:ABC transporter ATP-binding protein [Paenibacillus massiliensis]
MALSGRAGHVEHEEHWEHVAHVEHKDHVAHVEHVEHVEHLKHVKHLKHLGHTPDIAAGVSNLRLKFPREQELLFQGLSLSVRKGEKLLLLGPSGCGKSTLLQVLSGMIPRSIEVPMKCDEVIIPERSGVVFQDPDTQFCMSFADEELAFVLENRRIPREEMPSLIHDCLTQVGLAEEVARMPIQAMSQGMKQRLAVASVLAAEAEVLFLDEPTALLDEEGTLQVWDTIRSIAADKTLIIVEHKISDIIQLVDRIVVLSPDGEIIADGIPEEVFATSQDTLRAFGIWYPGVWSEATSPRLSNDAAADTNMSTNTDTDTDLNACTDINKGMNTEKAHCVANRLQRNENFYCNGASSVMELDNFAGLRSRTEVIRVEKAQIFPGQWIGITGANGVGKSSLLLSMMGLLKTTGRYEICHRPAGKTGQLAEHIGFVFQNSEFQFVTNSVYEEVEYSVLFDLPNPAQRKYTVQQLLARFGLLSLEHRHPYQLSLGQKRRLSIATAIIREPKVLLLDEPTFGQDARNTFSILDLLESLRSAGTAIIMVTHDAEAVRRYCTDEWRVRHGRVEHAINFSSS